MFFMSAMYNVTIGILNFDILLNNNKLLEHDKIRFDNNIAIVKNIFCLEV